MENVRRRVYELLIDPPEGDRLAKGVSLFILGLIAVNVIVSVAETEPDLARAYPRFFFYFEAFSVAVFTLEYVGRLWAATWNPEYQGAIRGRLKIASEPLTIIDLVAIAPFYLQVFIPGLDLRFVRALRLFRLFRIFKVGRYAESFTILVKVIRKRREELAVATVIVVIMVVLAASAMWLCEHQAQPEEFRNVPRAMWWAIITITTIGYGDVTPETTAGQIVGGLVAYLGICIFALPVAILGGAFLEEVQERRERASQEPEAPEPQGEKGGAPRSECSHTVCPHCGKPIRVELAGSGSERGAGETT